MDGSILEAEFSRQVEAMVGVLVLKPLEDITGKDLD
jgi:hypothetical protein